MHKNVQKFKWESEVAGYLTSQCEIAYPQNTYIAKRYSIDVFEAGCATYQAGYFIYLIAFASGENLKTCSRLELIIEEAREVFEKLDAGLSVSYLSSADDKKKRFAEVLEMNISGAEMLIKKEEIVKNIETEAREKWHKEIDELTEGMEIGSKEWKETVRSVSVTDFM